MDRSLVLVHGMIWFGVAVAGIGNDLVWPWLGLVLPVPQLSMAVAENGPVFRLQQGLVQTPNTERGEEDRGTADIEPPKDQIFSIPYTHAH